MLRVFLCQHWTQQTHGFQDQHVARIRHFRDVLNEKLMIQKFRNQRGERLNLMTRSYQ